MEVSCFGEWKEGIIDPEKWIEIADLWRRVAAGAGAPGRRRCRGPAA